tara:strand:- start:97881 stop:99023 length:1143 start_codon:yes stop_codon:yes gene_type:complete
MNRNGLHIVADENISGLEHFEKIASLTKIAGRDISPQAIRQADAILVRSVTKIDKELLDKSSVKFVGSTTSGIDHVDTNFLEQENIKFAYAPGSNANSVVQYVVACLALLSEKHGFDWRKLSVGIVGAGNIGSLLAYYLDKLSINFVIYDPFLDSKHPLAEHFVSFHEVLRQEVISLHTPLTTSGPEPSYHLFNAELIQKLKPDTILINAARGAVIDNQGLLSRLVDKQAGPLHCVLDVWENEPDISLPLLAQVEIGTCHIAGYSLEGKEQGTEQIYQAFTDFFGLHQADKYPLSQEKMPLKVDLVGKNPLQEINQSILAAYEIHIDHQQLQQLLNDNAVNSFDLLRKGYPLRREFPCYQLDYSAYSAEAENTLRKLGFS